MDGRIILKWTLKKQEHGSEPSGSISAVNSWVHDQPLASQEGLNHGIIREIGCVGVDGFRLSQDRVRWRVEHGNEPSGSIKDGEFLDWVRNH
jgi:hypothetical protein